MQGIFEFAVGSVVGRDHVLIGKNNQDAFRILSFPDTSVAVVCDGCGDSASRYSEMGAILGSYLIADAVVRNARRVIYSPAYENQLLLRDGFWERIRQDVLAHLRVLALQMGSSLTEVVSNSLLFTTVVALVTPELSVFTTIGDGVIIVNGEVVPVEKYPENKPPYMAYALVDSEIDPALLRFRIQRSVETLWLRSFLIGTDGVGELIEQARDYLPGKTEAVGEIAQFWEEDRYFANPDSVRRRLYLANQSGQRIDWENRRVAKYHGLLHDDTTLVVGRRMKNPEDEVEDV